MRYHNITKDDMLNGDGLRAVLWLAGCEHHCKGCQNPITWDPKGGIEFDEAAKAELFELLEKDYISGITFSGGDPLAPYNAPEVEELIEEIKGKYPGKTIWIYTGYMWEEILWLYPEILRKIGVLVDGEYVEYLRDPSLRWVGSANQRVIDVQESLKRVGVVLHGIHEQGRTPESEETR